MSIVGSDPLAFLTSQGGVVGTPLTEDGASGVDNLDVQQRGAVIGEPIPIVFARRVSGVGGVLVNPPATEARFEDDASSNITASYLLVLSEGQIDSIQVRDIFQGACRVGSYTQTYNRRAGTFVPGNYIDNTPNLRAPTYCGTSGTYAGLSTLAFSVTIPAGFDQWNRQVHCFIRGGIYVPRLLDSVTGPSNNVADLLLYLMRNSSRVPEAMIDTTSLLAAATFTNVNGFWFNGVVSESTNLRDWIGNTLQYFLLRQARIGGKEALKPLVQTNANGTIKTTAVTWAFTFTEEHVIPESFDIIYTPLADRKPFCAVMLWRQQDDLGIPVMRTTEVRYTGTAPDGPFEQHDLSGFCSSENHAVKVGAYILSKRNHVTHRLQLGVKPDAFNPSLAAGDLVRVRLERTPSTGASSVHDYLYEVDRIGKSLAGEVRLDLTHFPVDANLTSVVAQEVNAAVGSGLTIGTGLSAITCDINSFSDTSVPAETFTSGSFPDYGSSFGGFNPSGSGFGGIGVDNPSDGLGGQGGAEGGEISGATGPGGKAEVGDTLTFDPGCPGAYIEWRLIDTATGEITVVSAGVAAPYIIGGEGSGKQVVGVGKCPDSSSPTGYGPEIVSTPLQIEEAFDPSIYSYVRWVGNVTYAYADQLVETPYFRETGLYTSAWTLLDTVGGVKSVIVIVNIAGASVAPAGQREWGASGTYTFANPPANRNGAVAYIRKYNSSNGAYTDIVAPIPGLFAMSETGHYIGQTVPRPPGAFPFFLPLVESSDTIQTFAGNFEFSNDASTVLATWEGTPQE